MNNVYVIHVRLRRSKPLPGDSSPQELDEFEAWEDRVLKVIVAAGLADEAEFIDFDVEHEEQR